MSTETSLKQRIDADVKEAMRAKEKERLATLRLITAAIKQREVDARITLDDSQVLAVLEKMLKQRRDSVEQFAKGGRDDLVAKEQAEIAVIEAYLPAQLADEELDSLITEAIAAVAASSPADMGKVVAAVKPKVQGRADMGVVSGKIKARLSN